MAGQHVLLLGATGTIGRATARALLDAGHSVTALVRPGSDTAALSGCAIVTGSASRSEDLAVALSGPRVDAVVSCLASRTGAPQDAWAVDHAANSAALRAVLDRGIGRFVLLSAICVQKPRLAFQEAKLAFEAELRAAPLAWTIVRPTAFFKSLSGQIARVRDGRPFLLFGDGTLTACKPIGDADLGRFLARTLTDPGTVNRILPIGGPGPALTPRDQAAILFELTGRPPRFRRMPVAAMDAIVAGLSALGRISPRLAARAEFARIGRYYATESMLVWDAVRGCYDADATPEFGTQTLREHYAACLRGAVADDRGAHAIF
jgi:divinyl chlorophyllide a 8-vinyl-reductase